MKYVKLIAKKDTWFKEGTEVFHYDYDYNEKRRISLNEWEGCLDVGLVMVRGIRICEEGNGEVENLGYKVGEERIDGEACHPDEFDFEIVEE